MVCVFELTLLGDIFDNSISKSPHGVVIKDWKQKHVSFGVLCCLMLAWPGCSKVLQAVLPKMKENYLPLKVILAEFYLQSVYKFLCCYPTILHILSV